MFSGWYFERCYGYELRTLTESFERLDDNIHVVRSCFAAQLERFRRSRSSSSTSTTFATAVPRRSAGSFASRDGIKGTTGVTGNTGDTGDQGPTGDPGPGASYVNSTSYDDPTLTPGEALGPWTVVCDSGDLAVGGGGDVVHSNEGSGLPVLVESYQSNLGEWTSQYAEAPNGVTEGVTMTTFVLCVQGPE